MKKALMSIILIVFIGGTVFYVSGSERFCCVSDYEIRTQVQSKIIPGVMVDGPSKFRCPRCKHVNSNMPQHGEEWRCSKCNLDLIIWGNSIELIK